MQFGVRKVLVLSAVATLSVLGAASPANAAIVFAPPGGFQAGFVPPAAVTTVGGPLSFVNGDIQPHNVIATSDFLPKKAVKKTPWCKSYPAAKCPIFWSETVPLGGTATVLGTENLESGGRYEFFCSVHPGMKGTLVAL